MYSRRVRCSTLFAAVVVLVAGCPAQAQESAPSDIGDQHQHSTEQQHQHGTSPEASAEADQANNMAREGSGTAWLPDMTSMDAIHGQRGPWQLMLHENAFLQYLNESGDRGDDQFGSINWIMGMAQRPVGKGRVMFRGMFSAEPGTIRGCGYPRSAGQRRAV